MQEIQQKLRTRRWALCINKGAIAYELIPRLGFIERFKDLKEYFYILHSPDDENGNEHIHLVLYFENDKTFSCLFNYFVGAHIEPVKFWNKSIQYLIHKNDSNKRQYEVSDIRTNVDECTLSQYLECDEFVKLDTDTIINAIYQENLYSFTDLIAKFGLYQVSKFKAIISVLIEEAQLDNKSSYHKLLCSYDKVCMELEELKKNYNNLLEFEDFINNKE